MPNDSDVNIIKIENIKSVKIEEDIDQQKHLSENVHGSLIYNG